MCYCDQLRNRKIFKNCCFDLVSSDVASSKRKVMVVLEAIVDNDDVALEINIEPCWIWFRHCAEGADGP